MNFNVLLQPIGYKSHLSPFRSACGITLFGTWKLKSGSCYINICKNLTVKNTTERSGLFFVGDLRFEFRTHLTGMAKYSIPN